MRVRLNSVAVVVFAIVGNVSSAFAAYDVVWKVENGFRFYKTPAPFNAYSSVAEELRRPGTGDWILRTEQRLQQDSDWNGWASKWKDETCWDRTGYVLTNEGRCEDYTLPASHRVLLSVTDTDDVSDKCSVAINLIASQSAPQPDQNRRNQLFNQRRRETAGQQSGVACKNIPIEVPFAPAGDAGVEAAVTVTRAGASTVLAPVKIVVKDLLVLGMGDSFAAGVGNPDRPAQLRDDGTVNYGGSGTYLPVRKNGYSEAPLSEISGASANWLDIRCFRSQYGPQFRTALHLAADLPHAALTFLDLSCDGARIVEGLLHRKELDSGYDPDTADPDSQLGRASRLLCSSRQYRNVSYRLRFSDDASQCPPLGSNEICEYSKREYQRERIDRTMMRVCDPTRPDAFRRKIDIVLLSIGGNDIGFAPMVGNILLGDIKFSNRFLRYLATEVGIIHDAEIGKRRLGFLYGKYRVLDEAIDKYLPLRPGSPKPVFLAAYPLPIDDRAGATCGSTNENAAAARFSVDGNPSFDGFTSPPSGALSRLEAVTKTSCLLNIKRLGWFNGGADGDFALDHLTAADETCAGLADEAHAQQPKVDWQYEFALLEKWQGHGFCAVRAGDEIRASLSLPRFSSHAGTPVWTPPFDNLRPYGSRQRWVRTPNDAFAITNWQTFSGRIADKVNLLTATTTSAMHPSAEGYASMADALRTRVARFLCSERTNDFANEPLCASR